MQVMTFANAISEGMRAAMKHDEKVLCYGLGVTDPKGIFGTTIGLEEEFGSSRVFDVPISENALTGVAIGLSIQGYRPVLVHQRLDFSLLAMDQLVNGAAKWHYMFDGAMSVPITIRLIVGRGWGQGPTHSQNLQSWFAHIPGLKVVAPTTPKDAKGMLISSIMDNNPVLFIEHRWLHNQRGEVPDDAYETDLGVANRITAGNDVTIVGDTLMIVEALRAEKHLRAHGVCCEVIDLRTISPIDWATIYKSVNKTGRLLALDTAHGTGSVASEVMARVSSNCFGSLIAAPQRIAMPDVPVPTTIAMTKDFYPDFQVIIDQVSALLGKAIPTLPENELTAKRHDVPGDWFKGPF